MKVYLNTSVLIALANLQDQFHKLSLRFIEELAERDAPSAVGPPLLLELGKAIERRGLESALGVVQVIDGHRIELGAIDSEKLLDLVDRYVAYRVVEEKYSVDLLHYASAALLNCNHIASWDHTHFNRRVQRKVNRANTAAGLTNLKVGSPAEIMRSLGIE